MSYHQFQIFEKIGTEKSQIDTSIELSGKSQPINKAEYIFPQ